MVSSISAPIRIAFWGRGQRSFESAPSNVYRFSLHELDGVFCTVQIANVLHHLVIPFPGIESAHRRGDASGYCNCRPSRRELLHKKERHHQCDHELAQPALTRHLPSCVKPWHYEK